MFLNLDLNHLEHCLTIPIDSKISRQVCVRNLPIVLNIENLTYALLIKLSLVDYIHQLFQKCSLENNNFARKTQEHHIP